MKNFYIVFGGTTQEEKAYILNKANHFIQFNFLAKKSNILSSSEKYLKYFLEEKEKITYSKRNNSFLLRKSNFDFSTLNVTSGITINQEIKRMKFLFKSIKSLKDQIERSNIIILAHSRGCGLASSFANHLLNSNYKTGIKKFDEAYRNLISLNNIFRVILLDPVSKNRGSSSEFEKRYAKSIRYMCKNNQKEIVVCSAIGDRSIAYRTYADSIVGTKKGHKYKGSDVDGENMKINKYLKYIAVDTAHEGMMDNVDTIDKHRLYEKEPIKNYHFYDLSLLKVEYKQGVQSANELKIKLQSLKEARNGMGKSRWRTLVHKYTLDN